MESTFAFIYIQKTKVFIYLFFTSVFQQFKPYRIMWGSGENPIRTM